MLHTLNAPQQAAVLHTEGPLLVLAGAGSGKTRVITQKIVYLIQKKGLPAHRIAAITFTNKAAKEMLERVNQHLEGKMARGLVISTFHSLGLKILREEARVLGYKPQFSILDSSDAATLIGELLATTDKGEIRHAQQMLSFWKNEGLRPTEALTRFAQEPELLRIARIYGSYQDTLFAWQTVDFDDLIRLPLALFQDHPIVLQRWQTRFSYVLIDECQDTNPSQYALIRALVGARACFTAVGDDDQSIYAWRGATLDNLHRLQQEYPALQIIKLEQNYRSTRRILHAANTVIAHNPKLFEKRLWSELGEGDPVRVVMARDETEEAEKIATRLIGHRFERQTRYQDYAVLYRSNHQARLIEQAFRQNQIPYRVSGGTSFFEKTEVKDILAYLRLIANPDDDPAFIRACTTPRRGIGTKTLATLGQWAAQRHLSLFAAAFEMGLEAQLGRTHFESLQGFCRWIGGLQQRADTLPIAELLEGLVAHIDYQSWLEAGETPKGARARWQNVEALITWLSGREEDKNQTLPEMMQTISLLTMLEDRDADSDAVQLSTLHAAKGLEFPHVFLLGVEEGILPHQNAIDLNQVEEERRLMYVGITRAQRSLTLTWCQRRRKGGEWTRVEPSRFIEELPKEGVIHTGGKHHDAPQFTSQEEGKARIAALSALLKERTKKR